jgi:hypothetical protein
VSETKKDSDRTKQAKKIVELRLKQASSADIARKLDLPQARVTRELALARKNWEEARTLELTEASRRQRDIDGLEQAFVGGWIRKGLPGESNVITCLTEGPSDAVPAKADTYVAHMEAAATLIRRHARLRGSGSPGTNQSPTPDPTDELSEEEVDRELSRLGHELELRRTQASS